jgi:hypothetical protein
VRRKQEEGEEKRREKRKEEGKGKRKGKGIFFQTWKFLKNKR